MYVNARLEELLGDHRVLAASCLYYWSVMQSVCVTVVFADSSPSTNTVYYLYWKSLAEVTRLNTAGKDWRRFK